jgi:hypothetical protein
LQQLAKSIFKGLGGDNISTAKVQTVAHGWRQSWMPKTNQDGPRSDDAQVWALRSEILLVPQQTETQQHRGLSYIKSKDQRADFLTKSLRVLQFELLSFSREGV